MAESSRKVGGHKAPVVTDKSGREFVRNAAGELVSTAAAKKFQKPYPLPDALKAVAFEVMGGEDPLHLTEEERIARLMQFFTPAFEATQANDLLYMKGD